MSPYIFEMLVLGRFLPWVYHPLIVLNSIYNLMTPRFPLQPRLLPWIHSGRLGCICDLSVWTPNTRHPKLNMPKKQFLIFIPHSPPHQTSLLYAYISVKGDSIFSKPWESPLTLTYYSTHLMSNLTVNPGASSIHRIWLLHHPDQCSQPPSGTPASSLLSFWIQ